MDSFAFCGLAGCKPVALSGGDSGKGLGLKAAVGLASRCRNYPDDVKKVQEALNRFPPNEGGPSPKLVVDGIVGPKTSGAISAFQRKQFGVGKADGVVDVGMRTDERLAGVTSTYSSLPAEMMQHIPRALSIINIARSTISAARTFKLNGGGGFVGFGQASWNKVVKHFQVDKFPDWSSQLDWLNRIYIGMETAIGHIPMGMILLADEPANSNEGAFAFTFAGGYEPSERNKTYQGMSRGSVYLCPKMQTMKQDAFAYVLIHELAHFVGPTGQTGVQVDDYGYRHKPGYDALVPWQRVHNADNFAQFSFDAIGKPFNLKEHLLS